MPTTERTADASTPMRTEDDPARLIPVGGRGEDEAPRWFEDRFVADLAPVSSRWLRDHDYTHGKQGA